MAASANGQVEAMNFLIEQGSKISEANFFGWKATHTAVIGGHLASLECLMAHKAQMNLRDYHGYTPFLFASFLGRTSLLPYLLEQGAAVSETDEHGHSALLLATHAGHLDAIDFLLEQGSRFSEEADNNCGTLMIAAGNKNADLFEVLLERVPVGVRTKTFRQHQSYFLHYRTDMHTLFRFANIVHYLPQAQFTMHPSFVSGYEWALEELKDFNRKPAGLRILLKALFLKEDLSILVSLRDRHPSIIDLLRGLAKNISNDFSEALGVVLKKAKIKQSLVPQVLSILDVSQHPSYAQLLKSELSGETDFFKQDGPVLGGESSQNRFLI
jgi:ankyrin repeat protein